MSTKKGETIPGSERFPDRVLVQQYKDEHSDWLVLAETAEAAIEEDLGINETGELVAEYQLVGFVRLKRSTKVRRVPLG